MPGVSLRRGLTLAVFLLLALLVRPAQAQITFPSAGPVSAGNLIVRPEIGYTNETGGVQNIYEENVVLYGASPDLAFILENKALVANSANMVTSGRNSQQWAVGFGDTVIDTRYNLYELDGIGSTFRIAPYIGIDIPTGMDNTNDQLPRPLQPASGEWGTREALTTSYQTLRWNAQALVGFQDYASAAGYRQGSSLLADAAVHVLLWPQDLDREVPAELFASLETNYTLQAVDRLYGQTIAGTGGQLWLIDPGLIYSTPIWGFALTGLFPMLQQYRAPGATHDNYGVLFTFRWNFFTSFHW
jgi:hypothetical protein